MVVGRKTLTLLHLKRTGKRGREKVVNKLVVITD
jgi:hypothetical protein